MAKARPVREKVLTKFAAQDGARFTLRRLEHGTEFVLEHDAPEGKRLGKRAAFTITKAELRKLGAACAKECDPIQKERKAA